MATLWKGVLGWFHFLFTGICRRAAGMAWFFQLSNIWLGRKLYCSMYQWVGMFNLRYINGSYFYK